MKRMLTETEGYDLLRSYHIPVPDYSTARTPGEASDIAEKLGYPVVMKVSSPQVVHKSDAGGVVRGILSSAEAENAFHAITRNVKERVPGAFIEGIVVERQYPPGLELYIGGKTDQAFGKVLSVGMGGTLVELFRDVSIGILPLSPEALTGMLHDLRGYALVRGVRDMPALDESSLIEILVEIARMFSSNPSVMEFDINPVLLYQTGIIAVDARIYVRDGEGAEERAVVPNVPLALEIMHPESIAVIGASADPRKVGYTVFRNLLAFPGTLYAVNPRQQEILGRKAYASVRDIPGSIDAAVIAIPADQVYPVMEDLASKSVRLAVIISSGFSESGPDGRRRETDLLVLARHNGMRIIGPNCLGIVLPHQKINTTFDPITPRPGHIGFISQSGAVITTIIDWSLPEEIGFSAVISVGNQVDLGFIDYLDFAASDPATKAIILYIEEIKGGTAFLEKVSEITRAKPVIALKSGSSALGIEAASSHTGSLAGSYEVYQAAFRQSGIIPVFSIKEAFDVAELLVSEGYPRGNRAVVITTAGGFAVLASDYAERYGVVLSPLSAGLMAELNAVLPAIWSHKNPLDIIGDGGVDRYARVFDIMIKHQDEWDIAFVIAVPSAVLDPLHLAQEIARFSRNTHKMIVGCMLGGDSMRGGMKVLRHQHIPNYEEIEDAFRAVGRSLHRKA